MNDSRLKALIQFILAAEKELGVQAAIALVATNLNKLANEPQVQAHQVEFSDSVKSLQSTVLRLQSRFDPSICDQISTIGGKPYFVDNIAERISDWVAENPITPAVALTSLNEFQNQRNLFIENLKQLNTSLGKIGVTPSSLEEGTAEIGFQIPRELFENEFEQFIKKLGTIKLIIRSFQEVSPSVDNRIEVRQLSSTDPILFFGLAPEVIALIGGGVTWALHTWNQIESVRKLRSETRRNDAFTERETDEIFGPKIDQMIEKSVAEKVAELLGVDKPKGRDNERQAQLGWALKTLLWFTERGMKVEIKFLPGPASSDEESADALSDTEVAFNEMPAISAELSFPKIEDRPTLELPTLPPSLNEPSEK